ncbi:MAG: element excision factor XisI family protein [Halothece sp. Uz-M2-17]|nr:element excision factor XisI family protein [Halothece sp. Uz-M2-17]
MSVDVRLKNNKFYIENDWIEAKTTNELIRENTPKEEIVLAFSPR